MSAHTPGPWRVRLDTLEQFVLDVQYTNQELSQLAECKTGMGEIGPELAARIIEARAAKAKAKGGTA